MQPWSVSQPLSLVSIIIVVIITEHASDDASNKILKLLAYWLQIFFVKDKYLWSLQRYEDQAISWQLKICVLQHVLVICTTYIVYRDQASLYCFGPHANPQAS